ncbi:MAG: polyketide cyclase, partial [Sideroxydans sp.]|nr:polyketide cyclase [Sideroxydans sp.]
MPFISKLFSVFVSMDKMIGKDFEGGLENLKAVVEK